jgi:hypothetical protein
VDPGLGGQHRGQCAAPPWSIERALLQGGLLDEAMEGLFKCTGHCAWSSGARALHEPRRAVVGKAGDPCPQGRRGKGQRVGDRVEALPLDDVAYRVGPAEAPRLVRLLQEGMSGGEGIIGTVQCEGPPAGSLQKKLLQKYKKSSVTPRASPRIGTQPFRLKFPGSC